MVIFTSPHAIRNKTAICRVTQSRVCNTGWIQCSHACSCSKNIFKRSWQQPECFLNVLKQQRGADRWVKPLKKKNHGKSQHVWFRVFGMYACGCHVQSHWHESLIFFFLDILIYINHYPHLRWDRQVKPCLNCRLVKVEPLNWNVTGEGEESTWIGCKENGEKGTLLLKIYDQCGVQGIQVKGGSVA